MKRFKLHWLDGTTDIVEGNSISDAFTNAGFGTGALPALDYHEELKEQVDQTDIT